MRRAMLLFASLLMLSVPAFAQGDWAIRYACYPNITDAQKADGIFSATIWAVAEKKSGQVVKDLHQMALDNGMTR